MLQSTGLHLVLRAATATCPSNVGQLRKEASEHEIRLRRTIVGKAAVCFYHMAPGVFSRMRFRAWLLSADASADHQEGALSAWQDPWHLPRGSVSPASPRLRRSIQHLMQTTGRPRDIFSASTKQRPHLRAMATTTMLAFRSVSRGGCDNTPQKAHTGRDLQFSGELLQLRAVWTIADHHEFEYSVLRTKKVAASRSTGKPLVVTGVLGK